MIVGDLAVRTNDNPERQAGVELSGVAQFLNKSSAVEGDRVSKIHEVSKLAYGTLRGDQSLRVCEALVDGHPDGVDAKPSAAVEQEVEISDLAVRFFERFALVLPEMQHRDLAFQRRRIELCSRERRQDKTGQRLSDELFLETVDVAGPLRLSTDVSLHRNDQFVNGQTFGLFDQSW